MASTMTQAAPKPQELKLGQPSIFDGNPKKARAWINNTQLYLLVNKDVYNHDDKKIAFALSFMKEGAAELWALTKTEAAFIRNPPGFGTWTDFIKKFNDLFILENTKEQAIAWLTTTKVNDKLDILNYISKFKNNAALSEITNENVLINGTNKPFISNKFGKEPTKSPRGEITHSFPSKTTGTTTTPRKNETQMPWMLMPSESRNSPPKKDKGVLRTTFVSNAGNQDTGPTNAETPS